VDGVTWTQPSLGLYEYAGSRRLKDRPVGQVKHVRLSQVIRFGRSDDLGNCR